MYALIYSSLHLIPDSGEKNQYCNNLECEYFRRLTTASAIIIEKKGAWVSQTWVLSDNKIPTKLGTSQQGGQNITIKKVSQQLINDLVYLSIHTCGKQKYKLQKISWKNYNYEKTVVRLI